MADNRINVYKDVVRQLHSGVERKDLMVLKNDSMCNLEENVMPAATSIAILGQTMAIATKKDFSLKTETRVKDFKHVKDPGSFRACLVQTCNSVCDAFMEAHKSMDKIGMYTIRFQQNIKHVVTILLRGSEDERINALPIFLKSLKEDASKCTDLAKTTEDKFIIVIELIDEICESSEAVKGCYENQAIEAELNRKSLQREKAKIKVKKQNMKTESKQIIEVVARAKADLEKSMDQVPGVGKILAMNAVEDAMKMATGAMGLYAEYQMMAVSGGVYAVTSVLNKFTGEVSQTSNHVDDKASSQPELNLAFQHATRIHKCIEMMYEMFEDGENNQEKTIGLNKQETLLEIKDALVTIKEDIKQPDSSENPTVQKSTALTQNGIDLCDEMLQLRTDENANDLFKKINEIKSRSKAFELKAHVIFRHSHMSIPSAEKSKTTTQSKRSVELASENAQYVVEIRRKELDEAKKEREKFFEKLHETDERQTKVLHDLRKTKIDKINFTKIQMTLRQGLGALGDLKEQWNTLVLFFGNISNSIDACLSPETCQLEKVLSNSTYSIGNATRDIALEMAASVNSVAYSVGIIAELYTNISKQHLIPNIASLGKLIAYDPSKEKKDLESHRSKIQVDCDNARAKIQTLTRESRIKMEHRIDCMDKRLNAQEEKLPKLSPAKLLEIKENVENSDNSEFDYI